MAGPLVADLMVSISTTDADFVVKLIDVFPDDFKYDETMNLEKAMEKLSDGWLSDAGTWRNYERQITAIVLKNPNHLLRVKLPK